MSSWLVTPRRRCRPEQAGSWVNPPARASRRERAGSPSHGHRGRGLEHLGSGTARRSAWTSATTPVHRAAACRAAVRAVRRTQRRVPRRRAPGDERAGLQRHPTHTRRRRAAGVRPTPRRSRAHRGGRPRQPAAAMLVGAAAAHGGRGLSIVDSVCSRWGVRRLGDEGKMVWAIDGG